MIHSAVTCFICVTFAVIITCKETYCPPPMKRFLRVNNKTYRSMNNALIHVNEIQQEEVLRLTLRPNPYYSSPKCGILETGKGNYDFILGNHKKVS